MSLQAPFPWFGAKSRAAHLVWQALGDVPNYVEPFFGSGAVLLGRPSRQTPRVETVNDLDGYVANFWRALQAAPDDVARHADNPVNENDLHARHSWLVGQQADLVARLEGNPDFYDVKIAGWWAWGVSCWIGSGFCSGAGPWKVVDGQLVHLGDAGQGVNRKRVHLGNAGRGVNRQLVHLGDAGRGDRLLPWFRALAARLARVRVCSGDWSRVCGPTPTHKQGLTGVLLDPPYADTADREPDIYSTDSLTVAHDVRAWALEMGERTDMRIVLCGYDGEHDMPPSWRVVEWKAHGGYAGQGDGSNGNARRERLWLSPHCLGVARQGVLFEAAP